MGSKWKEQDVEKKSKKKIQLVVRPEVVDQDQRESRQTLKKWKSGY